MNIQKQIKDIQRQNKIIWGFNLFAVIELMIAIAAIICLQ